MKKKITLTSQDDFQGDGSAVQLLTAMAMLTRPANSAKAKFVATMAAVYSGCITLYRPMNRFTADAAATSKELILVPLSVVELAYYEYLSSACDLLKYPYNKPYHQLPAD